MPRYYMPGERKGNRTVVVRGYVDGRQFEIATRTVHKKAAKKEWREHVKAVRNSPSPESAADGALKNVAALYLQVRPGTRRRENLINRILGCPLPIDGQMIHFGNMHVAEITQIHADTVGKTLFPKAKASTINTAVYTQISAIMHYAAESELCPYKRFRRLKTERILPRRPKPGVVALLIANCPDVAQRSLLIFLTYQGWRITETLSLTWENVNLRNNTLTVYIRKVKVWKEIPMAPETYAALVDMGPRERGKVFPWSTAERVQDWMRRICKRLGVYVTPHMLRHEFASYLVEQDTPKEGILPASTWTNAASLGRYTHPGADYARQVINRTKGILRGTTGGETAKRLKA